MKKLLSILLMTTLLAVPLTACNQQKDSGDGTDRVSGQESVLSDFEEGSYTD